MVDYQAQIDKLYLLFTLFFFGTAGLLLFLLFYSPNPAIDANIQSFLKVIFFLLFLGGYYVCTLIFITDIINLLSGWAKEFWEKHKIISMLIALLVFFVIICIALYEIIGLIEAAKLIGGAIVIVILGAIGWLIKPHAEKFFKQKE